MLCSLALNSVAHPEAARDVTLEEQIRGRIPWPAPTSSDMVEYTFGNDSGGKTHCVL